mgnify:CR=1 FL=1
MNEFKLMQVQLSSEEKAALDKSAGAVKELVEVMANRAATTSGS